MKTPVKAVITTDTKTLYKDGILHLALSGDYLQQVKNFIELRKLSPGSPVILKLDDKESKSIKQLRTIHLLLRIYMQSDLSGSDSIEHLKTRVKYQYGIIEYWESSPGKVLATLKSFADYKMNELANVISGLFDEMIMRFAESGHHDSQFESMVMEFNNQEIVYPEKLELF